MHIVYTARAAGFKPGVSYRHPRYFCTTEYGVSSVEVEGDWPEVVKAYEDAGIEVTKAEHQKRPEAAKPNRRQKKVEPATEQE